MKKIGLILLMLYSFISFDQCKYSVDETDKFVDMQKLAIHKGKQTRRMPEVEGSEGETKKE